MPWIYYIRVRNEDDVKSKQTYKQTYAGIFGLVLVVEEAESRGQTVLDDLQYCCFSHTLQGLLVRKTLTGSPHKQVLPLQSPYRRWMVLVTRLLLSQVKSVWVRQGHKTINLYIKDVRFFNLHRESENLSICM